METSARTIDAMITYIEASTDHFTVTMNPLGKKSKKGRRACEKWKQCVQGLGPTTSLPELVRLQQEMTAEIEAIKLE